MASIHEYNSLPPEKRAQYIANLSPSDFDSLKSQMKGASKAASGIGERNEGWTKGQVSLMSVAILLFPPAGFLFFVASQINEDTRQQGFGILKNTVIYFAIVIFLFPFILAALFS